jgi:hypothetical protein
VQEGVAVRMSGTKEYKNAHGLAYLFSILFTKERERTTHITTITTDITTITTICQV